MQTEHNANRPLLLSIAKTGYLTTYIIAILVYIAEPSTVRTLSQRYPTQTGHFFSGIVCGA